jgi:apolipoprotein N-acyltransferase
LQFYRILGLTLLLILALTAVYFYKTKGVLISGCLMLIVWGYGFFTLKDADNLGFEKVNVRIVQPSIPQSQKWDSSLIRQNFKDYLDMSTAKTAIQPDLVIWGETAVPFLSNDEMGMDILKNTAKNNNFDLITGIVNFSMKTNIIILWHILQEIARRYFMTRFILFLSGNIFLLQNIFLLRLLLKV